MTKKITKKEMFTMIMEVINTVENENKEEMINFINHEIKLLTRKSSKSGQTKTQKENIELMAKLEFALAEFTEPVTISEFMAKSTSEVSTLSNQKLSALFKKLVEEKRVIRTEIKKKAYFSLA